MKSLSSRTGAVFAVLAAPLFASAALAAQSAEPQNEGETTEEQQSPAEKAEAEEEAAEPARICRYVRLDMSSRRKTKVCRTTEQWRELNNPR
jgi:hypothetical protein